MDLQERAAQIRNQKAKLKSQWEDRDTHIDEMRELRFQEGSVEVPTAYEAEVVRSTIAYEIVERVVGTLMANDPAMRVPPADEEATSKERSSRVEVATLATLKQLERQLDEETRERFVECLVADGHGAMRLQYAPQAWGGYPRRKSGEGLAAYNRRADDFRKGRPIPVAWVWADPKNVYPIWSDLGMEAVLEVDERQIWELDPEKYNVVREDPEIWQMVRGHAERSGAVEFVRFWTREDATFLAHGEIVHYEKHKLGRPPYVYKFGHAVSSRETGKLGLSVLYPLRKVIPYLDRLLSQKATAIRIWAWPTPVVQQSSLGIGAEGAGMIRSFDVTPGETVTLLPGEEISFLVWPGQGPDIDRQVGLIMEMIQRAGLSDVMYGQARSGDSGYLVNQLIAAARMKMKPLVEHAQRGIEQAIEILWEIVENEVRKPLYVYDGRWVKLDPEDLQGYRAVEYTLSPVLPTDEYARSSMAINEVHARIRSLTSAREMVGIEQPDKMETEILVEEWKRRPEVQQFITNQALERAGMELMKEKMVSQQDVMGASGDIPPALRQLLMKQMGIAPPGAEVQAGPTAAAIPEQRQVGKSVRPVGVRTGRPTGPKMQGME